MGILQKIPVDNAATDQAGSLEWLKCLNECIKYLEDHLAEQIDYNAVARIARCSVYHFQRVFSFIAGIPLSEYIRRRRLTVAAFELQGSTAKVIDTALKYGYESPEAFTRAFKSMHGVKPISVRNNGIILKAYPRLIFQLTLKGDIEMEYRIEEKKGFEVFGVETGVTNDQSQTIVPAFWSKCRNLGVLKKMHEDIGINQDIMLHAATYQCTEERHTYMICYPSPAAGSPEGYTTLAVPEATWAVFQLDDLDLMGNTTSEILGLWNRIFMDWFPISGYELTPNVPEFEMHYNKENGKYLCEIWMPITKK